jgi:hypothetical protein
MMRNCGADASAGGVPRHACRKCLGLGFPLDPIEHDPTMTGIRDDPRFETKRQVVRDRQARAQARLAATFARHGLSWAPA